MKLEVTLENWSVIGGNEDGYRKPDALAEDVRLRGYVYNHPNFMDGEAVVTSVAVLLSPELGVAQTHTTIYKLGEIDPHYKKYLEDADSQTTE